MIDSRGINIYRGKNIDAQDFSIIEFRSILPHHRRRPKQKFQTDQNLINMCKRIAISLMASCLMFIAQAQKNCPSGKSSADLLIEVSPFCSFDQDVEVCARYGTSSGALYQTDSLDTFCQRQSYRNPDGASRTRYKILLPALL